MKRALGAITDWETFSKMTEGEYEVPDGAPGHQSHLHPGTADASGGRRRSSMAEATRNAWMSAHHQVAAQDGAKARTSAPSSPRLSRHEEHNKVDAHSPVAAQDGAKAKTSAPSSPRLSRLEEHSKAEAHSPAQNGDMMSQKQLHS